MRDPRIEIRHKNGSPPIFDVTLWQIILQKFFQGHFVLRGPLEDYELRLNGEIVERPPEMDDDS